MNQFLRRGDRRVRLAVALSLLSGAFGCTSDPTPVAPTPTPPSDGSAAGPRVLVVNTLSETLSSLDLRTGTVQVNAAVVGQWANRIAATTDDQLLLVTASGDNAVDVLDARGLQQIWSIDVGAGRNPWTTRAIDDARALVTNWLGSEARLVQARSGRLDRAIATSAGPEGFAVADGRAYVACSNFGGTPGDFGEGFLDVVDLSALHVVASVSVGRNPQDVVVAPDGRIHVVCTGDYAGIVTGEIDVVDPASLQVVDTVAIGGSPERAVVGPDGMMWTVGFQGGLRRYDPSTLAVLDDPVDPLLTGSISAIAVDASSNTAYVASFDDDRLLAVDGHTRSVTNSWQVGDGPVDVLVLGE